MEGRAAAPGERVRRLAEEREAVIAAHVGAPCWLVPGPGDLGRVLGAAGEAVIGGVPRTRRVGVVQSNRGRRLIVGQSKLLGSQSGDPLAAAQVEAHLFTAPEQAKAEAGPGRAVAGGAGDGVQAELD